MAKNKKFRTTGKSGIADELLRFLNYSQGDIGLQKFIEKHGTGVLGYKDVKPIVKQILDDPNANPKIQEILKNAVGSLSAQKDMQRSSLAKMLKGGINKAIREKAGEITTKEGLDAFIGSLKTNDVFKRLPIEKQKRIIDTVIKGIGKKSLSKAAKLVKDLKPGDLEGMKGFLNHLRDVVEPMAGKGTTKGLRAKARELGVSGRKAAIRDRLMGIIPTGENLTEESLAKAVKTLERKGLTKKVLGASEFGKVEAALNAAKAGLAEGKVDFLTKATRSVNKFFTGKDKSKLIRSAPILFALSTLGNKALEYATTNKWNKELQRGQMEAQRQISEMSQQSSDDLFREALLRMNEAEFAGMAGSQPNITPSPVRRSISMNNPNGDEMDMLAPGEFMSGGI